MQGKVLDGDVYGTYVNNGISWWILKNFLKYVRQATKDKTY
jgi:hypothetical protein